MTKKALLYFNPDGDLIIDLSKNGNHPIKVNQAKLCLLAYLKMIKSKVRKTMLQSITDYVRALKK